MSVFHHLLPNLLKQLTATPVGLLFFLSPFLFILLLGGCGNQPDSWTRKIKLYHTQMPTECAGWEKLEMKKSTRYYLMKKDQSLLINMDAHNLRGRNLNCWK